MFSRTLSVRLDATCPRTRLEIDAVRGFIHVRTFDIGGDKPTRSRSNVAFSVFFFFRDRNVRETSAAINVRVKRYYGETNSRST